MMSFRKWVLAIVLGVALAAGIFMATKVVAPTLPQSALVLPMPVALVDFSLLDPAREVVNADSFRGQWDLVFFGFTHCPDICPATLQILTSARRELIAAGAEILPRIVFVSVDPERDTPESLAQYLGYFGEPILGVTGDLAEITKLTSTVGIYFEKAAGENENYSVDHSAAVLVLDKNGDFSALFSAPHDVAAFVHDLPIIMVAD